MADSKPFKSSGVVLQLRRTAPGSREWRQATGLQTWRDHGIATDWSSKDLIATPKRHHKGAK